MIFTQHKYHIFTKIAEKYLAVSNILLTHTHTHTHTHTQLLINKIFSGTAATLNSKAPCACCKASEWCFFYNYSFIN